MAIVEDFRLTCKCCNRTQENSAPRLESKNHKIFSIGCMVTTLAKMPLRWECILYRADKQFPVKIEYLTTITYVAVPRKPITWLLCFRVVVLYWNIIISSNNCIIMIYKTFWSQRKGVQIFGSIEEFSWNCNLSRKFKTVWTSSTPVIARVSRQQLILLRLPKEKLGFALEI